MQTAGEELQHKHARKTHPDPAAGTDTASRLANGNAAAVTPAATGSMPQGAAVSVSIQQAVVSGLLPTMTHHTTHSTSSSTLPQAEFDDSPRMQRVKLYRAMTSVFKRLASPVELETAVRHMLQGLGGEEVCTFMDTTYQYLCEKYATDDVVAMQVVLSDLVEGKI
ncbi:MAG: hypothetical protein WDW38_004900 [Sanguina aurantia]